MNNVIPFKYADKPIRVIRMDDGEPWFVAVDVCRVLGITDTSVAMRKLDDDEKMTLCLTLGHIEQGLSDNAPGTSLNLINESGLYSLIMTSRKPEARAFKRWVTHEILPSIRKTGSYALPGATLPTANPLTAYIAKVDILREASPFLKELVVIQKTYLQIYRGLGLRGPQLILAAQNAIRDNYGIEMARVAPLPLSPNGDGSYAAVMDDPLRTPTYLGQTLGLRNPGNAANTLLERAGLMERDVNGEPGPTESSKHLGEWIETGKKHHTGAPIMAWRWKEYATLAQLRQHQQGAA